MFAEQQEGFDLPNSPVLTKQNWAHTICSEFGLVSESMTVAVHAEKLKPNIAPRRMRPFFTRRAAGYQRVARYGWEAVCFSDSAISLRKTSTAGTEGDASASLPEYRHTGGASNGDQSGFVLPR
jgi:hypothetical protein